MKKKFTLVPTVLLFLCLLGTPAMGFDIIGLHDNLYVKSIDAMYIIDSPAPVIRIIMTMQNDSEKTVRVKNGVFKVTINPNKTYNVDGIHAALGGNKTLIPVDGLPLGVSKIGMGDEQNSYFVAKLSSLEIGQASSKSAIFELALPKDVSKRYGVVQKLVNFIGLPGSFKDIAMIGKATIGIKGERGWAYQDLSLLELFYVPKIQSEVLFQ